MDTMQGRAIGRDYSAADPSVVPQQKPITLDVTDSLGNLGSLADEIHSRLYALRDRLFGPEPTASPTSGGGSGAMNDLGCFAGAARSGFAGLRSTLNGIDRLSAEINNRL